jgi:hypothetical protein
VRHERIETSQLAVDSNALNTGESSCVLLPGETRASWFYIGWIPAT